MGHGLLVYNPNNREVVARWGVSERYQVYTFMEIPEYDLVLVLTHRGKFVFDSDTTEIINSDKCLVPKLELFKLKEEINIGVVIPPSANVSTPEVWMTSQLAEVFYIMTTDGFTFEEKVVEFHSGYSGKNMIRHIVTVEVSGRMFVAVASKHLIHMMDVVERKQMPHYFNCHEICSEITEIQSKFFFFCFCFSHLAHSSLLLSNVTLRKLKYGNLGI